MAALDIGQEMQSAQILDEVVRIARAMERRGSPRKEEPRKEREKLSLCPMAPCSSRWPIQRR